MKSNYFLLSFLLVVFCLFVFSCQKEGMVEYSEMVNIVAKSRNSSERTEKENCSNPVKLQLVAHRKNRQNSNYAKKILEKNQNIIAIAFYQEKEYYVGLYNQQIPKETKYIKEICSPTRQVICLEFAKIEQPSFGRSKVEDENENDNSNFIELVRRCFTF